MTRLLKGRVVKTRSVPENPPEGLPDPWVRLTIDGGLLTNFAEENNSVEYNPDGSVFSVSVQSGTTTIGGALGNSDDHIDGPSATIASANDAIIIARLTAESAIGGATGYTSGLMIRDDNTPGSRYFYASKISNVGGTPTNAGTRLRERTTADAGAVGISPNPHSEDQGLPQWWMLRLDRETSLLRTYFFAGASNPGTDPDTNWEFLGEREYTWMGTGDLIAMIVASANDTTDAGQTVTLEIDNVTLDTATELDHSAEVEDDVEYWPAQGSFTGTPFIRNRNNSSVGITAEGRGHGMDGRYCYTGATIGSPTTGTTPTIVHVTNRNNSGAGSLRAALETSGNRAIVFDVGGRIPITTKITIASGNVSVLGQCAPGLVLLDKTSDGNGHLIQVAGSNVSFHHVAFWFSAVPPNPGSGTGNNGNCIVAVGTGSPSENLLIDHCFIGGAIDQNFTINKDYEQVTLIDTLVCNPRGKDPGVDDFHKYNGNIAGNSGTENAKHITVTGCGFLNAKARNPRCLTEYLTLANNFMYNRIEETMNVTGKVAAGVDFFYNVVGNWFLPGPQNQGNQFLCNMGTGSGNQFFGDGSKIHFSLNASPTFINDEWDVINDRDNQEATVRQNTTVTEALPEGFVWRDMRSMTQAQRVQLFRNVGPFPASRNADIQTILDHWIEETDGYSTDYNVPGVANTNGAYDETDLDHDESATDSRYSNFEMDWHDKANALLNS